jgi:hypothetical protein
VYVTLGNRSVKIGNTKCWLDALVGHPFGSVFEVQSGPKGASFVRVSPSGAGQCSAFTAFSLREINSACLANIFTIGL